MQDRIPALEGLRAVAITLVLLSHGFLLREDSTRFNRAVSYVAGSLGGLGVAVFFAISGYLITTLLLNELRVRGGISLKGFYIRRAFRILPPAYLYLAVLWATGLSSHGAALSAAFFFRNYWPERRWFTEHFWSLSMEEHFYFLWPAILAIFGIRRAVWIACSGIVVTIVWRAWSLQHVTLPVPAFQRTDMRLDAFFFAGLLAIALQSDWRQRVSAFLNTSAFRITTALALAGTLVWTVAGSARGLGTLFVSALLPPIVVSIILLHGSCLYLFLESAPLRWLGRISYGMYLWQQCFFVAHTQANLGTAAAAFPFKFAAVVAIAASSYYLLERPLLKIGRNLSKRMQTHLPTQTVAGDKWLTVSWNNERSGANAQRGS